MNPGLDAIFFDFDGVILESADLKTEAIADSIPELTPEQRDAFRRYHLENLGVSRYVKFAWAYRNLLGREISDAESRRLGQEYSRAVYDKVRCAPFVPGIPGALEDLAADLTLFIVSGTPTEEVVALAEDRAVASYFAEIWGSPSEKPDIVRDVVARHRLAPARSLFIGDGRTDYEAAAETGLHFLARDTPDQRHVWDRLPVQRVPDLRELPQIVRAFDGDGD